MKINWKKYKKLVAAVVGVSILVILNQYDVRVLGLDGLVLDLITGAATAFGVYQVRNEM